MNTVVYETWVQPSAGLKVDTDHYFNRVLDYKLKLKSARQQYLSATFPAALSLEQSTFWTLEADHLKEHVDWLWRP